uniref:Putative glycosyl hydrolase family5 n=1 Tax=uncultured symbiotic protist of Reticulitermes speratus TaxID=403658 RepID=A4UWM9_9EUKA|nr:putative glycosyl hydrolase family5 [uncultured symbiotic protist of Reticulitermes speratus]
MFGLFVCLTFASPLPGGYYHARGHDIVDETDTIVQLWGVNWWGAESGECFPTNKDWNLDELINQVDSKGFNTWRFPISADRVHEWIGDWAEYGAAEDYCKKNNLKWFEDLIEKLSAKGHKLIFDIHSLHGNTYRDNLWFKKGYGPDYIIEALEFLAEHFNESDTVIGLDLKNEPHGLCQNNHGYNYSENGLFDGDQPAFEGGDFGALVSTKWDNSSDDNNWKHFIETAGNRIHAKNPNLLILVEGIECYNGHTTWWGGNLEAVKDYPITLNVPNKVVYSPHDYPGEVNAGSGRGWFCDETNFNTMWTEAWLPYWDYIYLENIAPILIGEWGLKFEKEQGQWTERKWVEASCTPGKWHTTQFWENSHNDGWAAAYITGGSVTPGHWANKTEQLPERAVLKNLNYGVVLPPRTAQIGEWVHTYYTGNYEIHPECSKSCNSIEFVPFYAPDECVEGHWVIDFVKAEGVGENIQATTWFRNLTRLIHQQNLSQTFWSLNPGSDDTDPLIWTEWINGQEKFVWKEILLEVINGSILNSTELTTPPKEEHACPVDPPYDLETVYPSIVSSNPPKSSFETISSESENSSSQPEVVPPVDNPSNQNDGSNAGLIGGLVGGILALVAGALIAAYFILRKKKLPSEMSDGLEPESVAPNIPKQNNILTQENPLWEHDEFAQGDEFNEIDEIIPNSI